nr:MAG TPA: tail tape measure protein [Caudoviricetes sp.]
MHVLSGFISLKDNATATLRAVRKEQSAFRRDVATTKKQLLSTWDKQYKARLDATAASKKAKELSDKLKPLRKKVVTAVALKDAATAKVKALSSKLKAVGKTVAKPVVSVVVKGAQALSSVGKGIAKVGKVAAAGVGAVAAAGAAGITALFNGSTDAAKAQIEAETKLEAVLGNVKSIQSQGAGAAAKAKSNLMGVASSLQQVGVIGDEVTLAGMQQLATFQLSDKEISTLSSGMTDLLAQQKGLNATQQDAVNIGNMIGKAMQGNVGALSRVGITFTDAQAEAIKTGDATQRAAIMAQVLKQNVGGVNKALAETDQGKIQQMQNAWGDMKEEVGKLALSMKGKFADVAMKNIPMIQKLGTTVMGTIAKVADVAMPVIDKVITYVTPVVDRVVGKIGSVASSIGPAFATIAKGFKPLIGPLKTFGTSVAGTLGMVASSVMPAVSSIIGTVQQVLPTVLPVLSTVIGTIGTAISQAAPIISGIVSALGGAIQTVAPVITTILSGIGDKVGNVLGFIASQTDWITGVINWAAPVIKDVLSTAWSVISPIMDICINVFKILFGVVKKVFPGIQKIIEKVWTVIKPIVSGIGTVIGGVSKGIGWVADKLGVGSGDKAGNNATGTPNWRGGMTWVGKHGPELMALPKGTRITSNQQSKRQVRKQEDDSPKPQGGKGGVVLNIHIPKLADQIIVREEADIDRIGEAVTKQVILAISNSA